jgi:hypothetical protein
MISPVAKLLPIQDNTKQKKDGRTSMPRMGLEPTIPVFYRAKTFHVLDRWAAVTGVTNLSNITPMSFFPISFRSIQTN